jgi:redox-sensitive bicupin YhaK (pirin superfamily)
LKNKKFEKKMTREVAKIVQNKEQSEGVGAKVRRSIGTREIPNLDPFLMLDEFNSKAPAGFFNLK